MNKKPKIFTISCRVFEDILENAVAVDVGEMSAIQLVELIDHLYQPFIEHVTRVVDPVDAGDTIVAELS